MKYLLPLFLLFVFTSCSLQKRLYNKGFYVSNSQTNKKSSIKDTTKTNTLLSTIKQIKKDNNTTLLLTQVTNNKTKEINYNTIIPFKRQTLLIIPCDTIVMKSGKTILGIITEVTESNVFFENCDDQSRFSSSIHKEDVNYIHFANPKNDLKLSRKGYFEKEKKSGFFIARLVVFFLLVLCGLIFALSQSFALSIYMLLAVIILAIVLAIMLLIALVLRINKKNKEKR